MWTYDNEDRYSLDNLRDSGYYDDSGSRLYQMRRGKCEDGLGEGGHGREKKENFVPQW